LKAPETGAKRLRPPTGAKEGRAPASVTFLRFQSGGQQGNSDFGATGIPPAPRRVTGTFGAGPAAQAADAG
jgi:hypothetical protein